MKGVQSMGSPGRENTNELPNKLSGHTVRCLWKKSNWEQFHTGIYLISLTLGILGPY